VSTATQTEDEGQEMPSREAVVSMSAAVQELTPPEGSVVVETSPDSSTTAQKESVGQEAPLETSPEPKGARLSAGDGADQVMSAWARAGKARSARARMARREERRAARARRWGEA
jgi:hypothetical protein